MDVGDSDLPEIVRGRRRRMRREAVEISGSDVILISDESPVNARPHSRIRSSATVDVVNLDGNSALSEPPPVAATSRRRRRVVTPLQPDEVAVALENLRAVAPHSREAPSARRRRRLESVVLDESVVDLTCPSSPTVGLVDLTSQITSRRLPTGRNRTTTTTSRRGRSRSQRRNATGRDAGEDGDQSLVVVRVEPASLEQPRVVVSDTPPPVVSDTPPPVVADTPPPPASTPPTSTIKCPICLDSWDAIHRSNRQLQSTVCGHVFCAPCIAQVIRTSKRCPTCRRALQPRSVHPIFIPLT